MYLPLGNQCSSEILEHWIDVGAPETFTLMPPIMYLRFLWRSDTELPLGMNVDRVLGLCVAFVSFALTGLRPKHEEPKPGCRQNVCVL